MTPKERAIWAATHTGNYPPGTIASDLAKYKDNIGFTALHFAAITGHLPQHTTNTDLANCIGYNGTSALHLAAQNTKLLTDTTVADLTAHQDFQGQTPWDTMLNTLHQIPKVALNTPPTLFKKHHHLAVHWATKAVEEDPSLKAKATLWLSKVLA